MEALLLTLSTFVSTLVGGFVGLHYQHRLHLLISFTAGVLIAVPFYDIIPEIFSITTEHNLDITPALIAILMGFLTIHTLEKLAMIHTAHESEYAEHKHPLVGLISASGLAFHSFLDGVGIGLGFHASAHVGILISMAVIAHDFSDGLNTVSVMVMHKNTPAKARMLLLIDATTPILGAASTRLFTIPDTLLVFYLGFFAGFLLYIGASDLLPEAHSQHSSFGMIGLTLLGVVFIFVVTRLT
jgi:ZIP family zinc transporter